MDHSFYCSSCDEETPHQVISSSSTMVVQCSRCGAVHREIPEAEPEPVRVKTIISSGLDSRVCSSEFTPGEAVALGDHIVVECGEEASGAEVTGIETGQKRVRKALVSEVTTLWTRAIDTVLVRASVHDGYITKALARDYEGDDEFTIGKGVEFEGVRFSITHMKLRNGAMITRDGRSARAYEIRRIYGTRF